MNIYEMAEISKCRQGSGRAYLEFLRVPALSMGLYVLPAGGADQQKPHREDEVYYVTRGQALARVGEEDREVGPGSLLYIPAGVPHHFHAIHEELELLVFFAPAESS